MKRTLVGGGDLSAGWDRTQDAGAHRRVRRVSTGERGCVVIQFKLIQREGLNKYIWKLVFSL